MQNRLHKLKKKGNPRNLGKVYYLTLEGVEQTKQLIYNQELTGNVTVKYRTPVPQVVPVVQMCGI